MAKRKHPGSKLPPQGIDPRRTGSPTTKTWKSDAQTAKTPKLPADLAIPPEKLTAENDK